jgi:preprotein translocase SecE subunit
LLGLLASVRLYWWLLPSVTGRSQVLGMQVPYASVWAAGLFIILGAVVLVFVSGLQTGIGALDGKTHLLVDLLIDTEAEMNKVSWPSRDELTNSTAAVLVTILIAGVSLFVVDMLIGFLMRSFRVLMK